MEIVNAGHAMEYGQEMTGKLYGVGLGPGDPELMTMRAHKLISNAKVVAYPALPGHESLARSIAADAIPASATEIVVEIPMTAERNAAQAAYDLASREISGHLEYGSDVVYLCEGDPFFYGSFIYLFDRLSGDCKIEVIPGISSIMACSAIAGLPLVARDERLMVLPATLDERELKAGIECSESVAIIKLGRHLSRVKDMIRSLGLVKDSIYAERASTKNEVVCPLEMAPGDAPFFSMIIIAKRVDFR